MFAFSRKIFNPCYRQKSKGNILVPIGKCLNQNFFYVPQSLVNSDGVFIIFLKHFDILMFALRSIWKCRNSQFLRYIAFYWTIFSSEKSIYTTLSTYWMSIQPSVLSFTRNTLWQMKSIDTIIPVTHQSPNHQSFVF